MQLSKKLLLKSFSRFSRYYSISIHPWENPSVSPFQKRLRGNCSPWKETIANDSRISRIPGCIPRKKRNIIDTATCFERCRRENTRKRRVRDSSSIGGGITAAISSFPDLCRRFNLELLRLLGACLSFESAFAPRRTKPHCRKLESLPLTVESSSS